MMSSSRFPVSTTPSNHYGIEAPTTPRWRLRSKRPGGLIIQGSTKQAFGAYANANVCIEDMTWLSEKEI